MPAPRAPGVGDSIEKWEAWIENCTKYLASEGKAPAFHIVQKFNTYKNGEIQKFGTNWANVLKWGEETKMIKIMENNWKYVAYLHLKGAKPKTFGMKPY